MTYRNDFERRPAWLASGLPVDQKTRQAALALMHLNAIRDSAVLSGQNLTSLDLARSILAYDFNGNTMNAFPTGADLASGVAIPLEGRDG